MTVVLDGTKSQIMDALNWFASDGGAGGWVVVYFSGHGIQLSGVNYMVPVDASASTGMVSRVARAVIGLRWLRCIVYADSELDLDLCVYRVVVRGRQGCHGEMWSVGIQAPPRGKAWGIIRVPGGMSK